MRPGRQSLTEEGGGHAEQARHRVQLVLADDLDVVGVVARAAGGELYVADEQYRGHDAEHVHERDAQDGQAGPPLREALRVGRLVLSRVAGGVEEAEVTHSVSVEAELLPLLGTEAREHLVEYVVVLLHGDGRDDAALVEEVAVDLGAIERAVRHLHLDEVPDPARLSVVPRLGGAERANHGEAGRQVLERVRLGAAVSRGRRGLEELPQHDHGGVRLAGAAGARDDDRLRISGLALQPHNLSHHPRQLGTLGAVTRGAEGEGVAHVAKGVDGDHNGADVRLKYRVIPT